jgi:hypothetical protein
MHRSIARYPTIVKLLVGSESKPWSLDCRRCTRRRRDCPSGEFGLWNLRGIAWWFAVDHG